MKDILENWEKQYLDSEWKYYIKENSAIFYKPTKSEPVPRTARVDFEKDGYRFECHHQLIKDKGKGNPVHTLERIIDNKHLNSSLTRTLALFDPVAPCRGDVGPTPIVNIKINNVMSRK